MFLECNVKIEFKDRKNGSIVHVSNFSNIVVKFFNADRGYTLCLQTPHGPSKILLQPGLQVHQNFLDDGRMTICTPGRRFHQIMLQNAEPSDLRRLLDCLQGKKPSGGPMESPGRARVRSHGAGSRMLASPGERVRVQGGASKVQKKIRQVLTPGSRGKKKTRMFSPAGNQSFARARNLKDDGITKALFTGQKDASDKKNIRNAPHLQCTQQLKNSETRLKSNNAGQDLGPEQERALREVLQGKNVFITGGAGTGKSLVLKLILRYVAKRHHRPGQVVATATTALAACHMNGTTVHRFAGIGVNLKTKEEAAKSVQKKKAATKRWKTIKVLIIDEISMLDGQLFDTLEYTARLIRGNNRPFGGIQLVLSGDFFQLPPVCRRGETKAFCFQAQKWDNCIQETVELRNVYRQKDKEFVNLLNRIRWGESNTDILSTLAKHLGKRLRNHEGIIETKLLSHKKDVEQINAKHLAELPGQRVCFESKDTVFQGNTQSANTLLEEACPARDLICLKVGAQVILLKSLSLAKGLVNGARGVVTGFSSNRRAVRVKFMGGLEQEVGPAEWKVVVGNQEVCSRRQVPFELGWALSIHKSQGMSLDCVAVSLAHVFEYGQAYVALSRARSLQGLAILGTLSSKCILAHPEVKRFYAGIKGGEDAKSDFS